MDKRQLWRQYGYVLNLTREFINPQIIRKSNSISDITNTKLEFRNKLECYSRLCGKILKSLSMYSNQILNKRQHNLSNSILNDINKISIKPIEIKNNWSFDGILLVLYYCWHDVHVKDRVTLIHCLAKMLKTLIMKSQNCDIKSEDNLESNMNYISNLEFGSPEDAIYRFLIFCLTEDSCKLNSLKKLGRKVSDAIYSKGNPIKTWKELARVTNISTHKIDSNNTLFYQTIKECKRIKDIALLIVSLQLLYSSGTDMLYLHKPIQLCIYELQRIINRIEGNRGCYHEFDDVIHFRDAISIAHALRLLNYEDLNIFKIIFDSTFSRHINFENRIHLPLITLIDCSQATGALLYSKLFHQSMILTLLSNIKIALYKLGVTSIEYDELDSERCHGLCPDCQNEIQQSYQGDTIKLELLANQVGMSVFLLAGRAGILCDICCNRLNITANIQVKFIKQPISLWKSIQRHLIQLENIIDNPDLSGIINRTIDSVNILLENYKI